MSSFSLDIENGSAHHVRPNKLIMNEKKTSRTKRELIWSSIFYHTNTLIYYVSFGLCIEFRGHLLLVHLKAFLMVSTDINTGNTSLGKKYKIEYVLFLYIYIYISFQNNFNPGFDHRIELKKNWIYFSLAINVSYRCKITTWILHGCSISKSLFLHCVLGGCQFILYQYMHWHLTYNTISYCVVLCK